MLPDVHLLRRHGQNSVWSCERWRASIARTSASRIFSLEPVTFLDSSSDERSNGLCSVFEARCFSGYDGRVVKDSELVKQKDDWAL